MNSPRNAEPSDFVWPAEWESHQAVWVAWPHNRDTWPGHFEHVPDSFVRFVYQLSRVTKVHVLGGPEGVEPAARERLNFISNVIVHPVPTNDTWIRDFGPTFVRCKTDGQMVGIDWGFNAWGGKYLPFDDDAAAAERICDIIGCPRVASALHCEGGALDGDGLGTLLTTSSCLLTPTRNPGWNRQRVESELSRLLGVTKILWVDGGGLEGDDTDGHIDQLARFIGPSRIVAAVSSSRDDSNAEALAKNIQQLRDATDARGKRLEVFELPTPPPRLVDGKRVPESYCNFLFANGRLILPTFRSEATDRSAIRLLSKLLPNHEIVPLDAHDLIWGLGAFHCASQQQPLA